MTTTNQTTLPRLRLSTRPLRLPRQAVPPLPLSPLLAEPPLVAQSPPHRPLPLLQRVVDLLSPHNRNRVNRNR